MIYDEPNNLNLCNKIQTCWHNAALAITSAIRGSSRERLRSFKKNYFPFMGRGHLVKKRPLGHKIRLLVKFLKCSHIIYHSIAKLILTKKNFSLRV